MLNMGCVGEMLARRRRREAKLRKTHGLMKRRARRDARTRSIKSVEGKNARAEIGCQRPEEAVHPQNTVDQHIT